MKVFLSLTLAMGLVRKPDIQDYFSNCETHETSFFSKMMSRGQVFEHFQQFTAMLRNNFLNINPRRSWLLKRERKRKLVSVCTIPQKPTSLE